MSSPDPREAGPGQLLIDEPAPGVARLTISNAAKAGALDHAILDRFVEVLPQLDQRCLLITGEERTFSAGYDLVSASAALAETPDERFAERAEQLIAHPFTAAMEAIDAFPYPTVAALNGHAIGGGLELAVVCDLRIAAHDIRLGMPPARLGLVYSHTGIRKFIETVGAARTRELFLTARRIDATAAGAWGLVNELVAHDELTETALAWTRGIAANAPLAQSGNKRIINALLRDDARLDPALETELIALRKACFSSADFREGVRAFAEKRPAEWQGR